MNPMPRISCLAVLCAALGLGGAVPAGARPQGQFACEAMLSRWNEIARVPLEGWRFRPAGGFAGEDPALDDSAWMTVPNNHAWEASTVWLRRWVEIPAERGGYSFRGARIEFRWSISNDFPRYDTVFVDGVQRHHAQAAEPVVLTASAEPGRRYLVAIRTQVPAGRARFRNAALELVTVPGRPDVRTILTECYALERINSTSGEGRAARSRVLEAALGKIDYDAVERADQAAIDASAEAMRRALQPLREWIKGYTIHGVGNSHIDMAWLWPWTETVEVTRDTFASALQLMHEFPEYYFSFSSVQTYQWMEEKYPLLFNEIRKRVAEGRWELVGGMWVEPDLNMPDGESLVRQILLGKRWLRDRFGKDVRVGYNPDSFGYNWQLAQIYKRSGIDYFVTQKITWNDTTRFPHKLFWWESPDGSRLLTYFPNDYVNQMDPLKMSRDFAEHAGVHKLPVLLDLYGIGDHGGGPTRRMLESARAWGAEERLFPNIKLTRLHDFFALLERMPETAQMPVWRNELYLEYHRGVQTTQASTKKNNRRNEALVLNAEKFASLAHVLAGGAPEGRAYAYPRTKFEEAWRKLLFNQFHDILPGTSIPPVFVDAERDHALIRYLGSDILGSALAEIAARVRTAGPGVPVVVFNPLGWTRNGVVETEVRLPAPAAGVAVRDPRGRLAIAEVLSTDRTTHRVRVRFLAEGVPSLGYAVYRVVPARQSSSGATDLKSAETTLENEFLRVVVDPASGCVTSLFDKRNKREALAPGSCGNLLQAFQDRPRDWDAWNIDANFEEVMWNLDKAEEVQLIERGPVRAVIRVRKKFQKSEFTQDITLYARSPELTVHMSADWHEERILLKVAFPLPVASDFATYEIPYGAIPRPTTRNTPQEKAMFEVPAIRWADLSDESYGVSLLNDSKYGYDTKGNVMRLSLLRSPKWPDPNADMGAHSFTYAIFPHAGTWSTGGTVRRGYELNDPLIPVVATPHGGSLPPVHSFVEVSPENVVLTAIKKAEDDDAILIRFYEFAGRETQVTLRLPPGATRAAETDLQEVEGAALRVTGDAEGRNPRAEAGSQPSGLRRQASVIVPTKPYEIKTVKVWFTAPH